MGICRAGSLGILGAMAADLSCDLEAQCSLVSGSIMHGFGGRSRRRGRMAQARNGPILLERSYGWFALHFADEPHGRAKTQGIHPSFPTFVRLAYAWLIVAD